MNYNGDNVYKVFFFICLVFYGICFQKSQLNFLHAASIWQ